MQFLVRVFENKVPGCPFPQYVFQHVQTVKAGLYYSAAE